MVMKKLCFCEWILLCHLLLATVVCSKHHGNPANDLVDIINQNRTAQKLPQLNDSPGLGCMALQYVELCKGNCSGNSAVNCKPPDGDFTEVFVPNRGVELPSIGTIHCGLSIQIYGSIASLSNVLVTDKKTLSLVRNKSHSEVGVGLVGVHKGPFFWCVLFYLVMVGQILPLFLKIVVKGSSRRKGAIVEVPCSAGQRTAMFLNYIVLGFLAC